MDSDSLAQIIILVVLILMSAFFSASETAFSSLNRIRLKMMADEGNKRAALAYDMGERFDKLLSTILIGNNIVNITSTSIATVLFIKILGSSATGTTVSTVVMTIAVLIFGEISPKVIAKEAPEKFACLAAPILKATMFILTPIVAFFVLFRKLIGKMFRFSDNTAITGDELLEIVDEAESGGGLEKEESELIRSAISFSECPVSDILTPRVDIVGVDIDDPIEEIAAIFDESGFSRLPVYDDSVDNILGIIHTRDFNKYVIGEKKPLSSIIKDAVYVAKQISINELLKIMQEKKTHIAVVADEYGGTVGIATMEDILEELVGEIWDEYDEVVEEFKVLSDDSVAVLSSISPEKMFEYFNVPKAETDASSVGGWVVENLGKLAEVGDTFSYENLDIKVTKVEERRIIEILVKINEKDIDNED